MTFNDPVNLCNAILSIVIAILLLISPALESGMQLLFFHDGWKDLEMALARNGVLPDLAIALGVQVLFCCYFLFMWEIRPSMIAPAMAVALFCEAIAVVLFCEVMAWPDSKYVASRAVLWIAAGYARLLWVKTDIHTKGILIVTLLVCDTFPAFDAWSPKHNKQHQHTLMCLCGYPHDKIH